jgi:hypothetical protein
VTLHEQSVLITDAEPSRDRQHAARVRRYSILMGGRLLLFVAAAATYPFSMWAAVGLLALSIPLPWMAVLIANDAPPRRREDTHRLTSAAERRAIEVREHVVVDAEPGTVVVEPAMISRAPRTPTDGLETHSQG